MNEPIRVESSDVIEALKTQRNEALDREINMFAWAQTLLRENKALRAELEFIKSEDRNAT